MNFLIRPNTSHKSSYLAMIEEWGKYESLQDTSPGALFQGSSFEEFLETIQNDRVNPGNGKVPATLFFLMNDMGRILGAIQIRHTLGNDRLREWGGHIGYGIRPSERRKGYATEMLKLALPEAKKLGFDRVMLGCLDDNIGSVRTIEKNGGVFERYAEHDGKRSKVYWITL